MFYFVIATTVVLEDCWLNHPLNFNKVIQALIKWLFSNTTNKQVSLFNTVLLKGSTTSSCKTLPQLPDNSQNKKSRLHSIRSISIVLFGPLISVWI